MTHPQTATPFLVLIDTREQDPLPFPQSVPTRRATLYPGDYSIDGLTDLFAVERKSLEDLIGSLIGRKTLADGSSRLNRDRLAEELLAMRSHKFRAVAVTAPRHAIEHHLYRSRIPPENVIGMIASLEALTGVQFKFFANADEAARWTAIEALHFWRNANGLSTLRPKVRTERLAPRHEASARPSPASPLTEG